MLNNKFGTAIKGALAVLFWLAVWQIAAMKIDQEILLVSPVQVFARLLVLMREAAFWHTVAKTLWSIMRGFVYALLIGIIAAVFSNLSTLFHTLLKPILGTIRATPVTSFILLALVWLHTGTVPVFATFIMVFPIIWANVFAGIENVDKGLLQMAKVYQFGWYKTLLSVYIPSVMPYFIAAFGTSLGLAWKAGIAAEVIALPKASIGANLYYSKIYLETADLFAWTAVVIILSMLLETIFVGLGKQMGKKYNV